MGAGGGWVDWLEIIRINANLVWRNYPSGTELGNKYQVTGITSWIISNKYWIRLLSHTMFKESQLQWTKLKIKGGHPGMYIVQRLCHRGGRGKKMAFGLFEKGNGGKNLPWLGPVGEKNGPTCSIYIPGRTMFVSLCYKCFPLFNSHNFCTIFLLVFC